MKKLAALIPTALFIICASTAYPQSLADLAQKEAERRQQVKAERVITDEDAAKYRSEPLQSIDKTLPAAKPDTQGNAKEAAEGAQGEKPKSDEPVDFQGRPESYWRDTMASARQRVKDLENESNALILKLNDLQTKFYQESDGYKQESIQREIQKSYYEQDKNKEDLTKAKDILQDLEKEARKSGALPGWIQ